MSEVVAIKRALEPEIKNEAEKRQKTGKRPSPESDKGRTDEVVAKTVGVGRDTLAKAEVVVAAAEKEPEKFGNLVERVDAGKTSVNYAYQVVKAEEKKEQGKEVLLP